MKFDIREFFEKKTIVKIQASLKEDKNKQYFTFLEREIFQTEVVEEIKTHILNSVTVFRKSCRL
jgi:hypothetical protein